MAAADIEKMRSLVTDWTRSVYDYAFVLALQEVPWKEWLSSERPFHCRKEYLDFYPRWIASSKLSSIRGLDRFQERHLINGTTQTFDEAYFTHRKRRLRVFRGEYGYHRRIVRDAVFLEDAPLEKDDYAIVSAPFCSTGTVHPELGSLLDRAAGLSVPVIIDCAYFGTCVDFHFDAGHPAIESVSFSLTKGVGLGDVRSGIRFSNIRDENPICQQNEYDHTVLAAARIGLYMMRRFSPDHIPTRFREAQLQVCKELGIEATPCMHLALGGDEWNEFRVDDKYNRLGIRELVKARFQKKI